MQERTIEYILHYGPQFEIELRKRKANDPRFAFLFEQVFKGQLAHASNTTTNYPHKNSRVIPEDSSDSDTEEETKDVLTPKKEHRLYQMINSITLYTISNITFHCILYSKSASRIIQMIINRLYQTNQLELFYLIHDLLYNSFRCAYPNAWKYRVEFELKLLDVVRMVRKEFRIQVFECLELWKEWGFYESDFIGELKKEFDADRVPSDVNKGTIATETLGDVSKTVWNGGGTLGDGGKSVVEVVSEKPEKVVEPEPSIPTVTLESLPTKTNDAVQTDDSDPIGGLATTKPQESITNTVKSVIKPLKSKALKPVFNAFHSIDEDSFLDELIDKNNTKAVEKKSFTIKPFKSTLIKGKTIPINIKSDPTRFHGITQVVEETKPIQPLTTNIKPIKISKEQTVPKDDLEDILNCDLSEALVDPDPDLDGVPWDEEHQTQEQECKDALSIDIHESNASIESHVSPNPLSPTKEPKTNSNPTQTTALPNNSPKDPESDIDMFS